MARTPLYSLLRRAALLRRSSLASPEPLREHVEKLREAARLERAVRGGGLDRRTFLRASAGAAALAAFPFAASGCGGGGSRVGVVGAGLSGLHCAYRLKNAGVDVRVFEAWNRTGGRTFTARGMLAGDQICELGGELVDSNHETMFALVDELGLTLDDLEESAGIRAETFHFNGAVLNDADIVEAFDTVAPSLSAAFAAAETDDAEYARLDAITIPEFLDSVPGASDLIKRILLVAYTGEYGLEPEDQSILNLVYLVDAEVTDPFRIFGESNERYHVHTGSESIAESFTTSLGDRVALESRLTAIRRGSDGRVVLSFDTAGGSIEETFDQVVLTLPFTMLRTVDIEAGLFEADKQQAIDELGYGQNAKLMMQFGGRVWRTAHMAGGGGFGDNGIQSFWETSRGQDGAEGIVTHFAGGNGGLALAAGDAASQAARVLPLLDEVFPGVEGDFNGNAIRMQWPDAPFHRGSYACYRPGQWAFYGVEGRAEGNVHFAGEHTSEDFQGYMEGAAESGARAANEVLVGLGLMDPVAPLRLRGRRARAR